MPWVEDELFQGDRPVNDAEFSIPTPDTFRSPFQDPVTAKPTITGASVDKDSVITNAANMISSFASGQKFKAEDGYDPFDDMSGYETYADELRDASGREEMAHLKSRIDDERRTAETIASGNGWQQLAGAAAVMTADSPIMALPIGGALWATYRTTGRILEGAARTAAYGAAITAGQEAFLQQAQMTRTGEESLTNIAAATLLSGVLGGAVGAIPAREAAVLAKTLDKDMTIPTSPFEQNSPALDPFHPDSVFGADRAMGKLTKPAGINFTPTKKPTDIVDFIMGRGGINSADANIGDIKAFDLKAMNKGYNKGVLISKKGKNIDDLREAAELEGFLPPNSTVADFLDAVDRTVRGDYVFSSAQAKEVAAYKESLSANRGNDMVDIEAQGVFNILKQKGVTDVTPDEMRAIAEKHLMGSDETLEDTVVEWLERSQLNKETLSNAEVIKDHAKKVGVELNEVQIREAARLKQEVPDYSNDDAIADVIAQREAFGESTVGAAAFKKFTPEDTEIRGLKRTKAAYKKLPAFLRNPAMDLAVSLSSKVRELGNLLADHSLALNMHARGKSFGASVETKIKAYNLLKAKYHQESFEAWKAYRARVKAANKNGGLDAAERLGSNKDGSLRFNEFFAEASKASRRGDTHAIPEVQATAQSARKNVFSPIFQRAKDVGFFKDLDEASVKTAESWLQRKYNIPKILAERGKIKEVILADLLEKESAKTDTRVALKPLVDTYKRLNKEISKLERRIERRQDTADLIEARREEASLMNQFAYKRSAEMSEPIDELRKQIDKIGKTIEEELDRLKEIADEIKEGKADFPELVEFEKQYQRISRSLSDITEKSDLIDMVDAAEEIEAGFDMLMAKFGEALDITKGNIKQLRDDPLLDGVKALEKERAKLSKKIAPLRKKLKELRKEKADIEKTRKPLARGGAPFETKARSRVNSLSDSLSGKEYAIDDLEIKLQEKQKLVAETEAEIRKLIDSYEGNTSKSAKAAMKREGANNAKRPAGKAPLNTAGTEVLNAARRLAKSIGKERAEIDELAEQIIDRLTNQTGGRIPYEANTGKASFSTVDTNLRGSMKQRVWDIADEKIEPWLENDLNTLVDSYTRTMAPDNEIMGQFGTLDVTELKKEIQADYNRLRVLKEGGDKSLAKVNLDEAMKKDMDNLQSSIEKLRGQYAQPDDYASAKHVTERTLLAWNFTRLLGDMVTSSIPDIGRHVMVHGIGRVFNDSFRSMIKDYKGFQMLKNEALEMGTALDMTTSYTSLMRSHGDDFTPVTGKLDEFTNKASQIVGNATGMNIWNAGQKTFAGIMTQSRMMKSIIKLGDTGTIAAKEMEYLARHGIDAKMAKRIAGQFQKHGEAREVVNVPNARNWDDVSARNVFRSAVRHAVDETIVTPGLDRPLWMSKPGWRLISQFKSFTFSSAQRVTMAGLQQADAAVAQGIMLMTFLGANVYFAKSWLAGREISDDPAVWIAEGVDRSGVTGWFFDVNNMVEKVTAGRIGVNALKGGPQMSRYASRNAVGALLGPSFGLAQDLFNITGSAFSDEWDEKDTHAARKVLPLQNIPYLRGIFDQMEHSFNEQVGVPDSGKVKSYGTE